MPSPPLPPPPFPSALVSLSRDLQKVVMLHWPRFQEERREQRGRARRLGLGRVPTALFDLYRELQNKYKAHFRTLAHDRTHLFYTLSDEYPGF